MSKEKRRLIEKIYFKISNYFYKISPKLKVKMDYRLATGKKLNLEEPRDFNEKLQWLNLYEENEKKIQCTDKYEVRNYLKEKGMEEYLPKLLGEYTDANAINFEELPNKFVLKCTHGCGFNIICQNKETLNREQVKQKLNKWMQTDFGKMAGEVHYSKIKPRIICEEFIDALGEEVPIDYKVHCFNGVPKFIMACTERFERLKFIFYDLNWKRLEYQSKDWYSDKKVERPKGLEKMIEIAKEISKDFKFVRVDFYDVNGKVMIGELTFTPNAGRIKYMSDEALLEIGNMLDIKNHKKN